MKCFIRNRFLLFLLLDCNKTEYSVTFKKIFLICSCLNLHEKINTHSYSPALLFRIGV
jgi:hypothetical protein